MQSDKEHQNKGKSRQTCVSLIFGKQSIALRLELHFAEIYE